MAKLELIFFLFFRLIGKQCAKELFLKFNWGHKQCRQIFIRQLLKLFIYIEPFIYQIPQIYKLIRLKTTDGISLPFVTLILINQEIFVFQTQRVTLGDCEDFVSMIQSMIVFLIIVLSRKYFIFAKVFVYFSAIMYFALAKKLISSDTNEVLDSVKLILESIAPYFQVYYYCKYKDATALSITTCILEVLDNWHTVRKSYIYLKHLPLLILRTVSLIGRIIYTIQAIQFARNKNRNSKGHQVSKKTDKQLD